MANREGWKELKVWHIYVMNENFGDNVLGEGVKNLFKTELNIQRHSISSFNIFKLDWNNPNLIRKINKSVDLIIIGGGGLISGNGGFYFRMNRALIKNIKTPMVFYSLGYNRFRGEPHFNDETLLSLRETRDRAIFFSTRRDGSMKMLKERSFIVKDSPDPAFWLAPSYSQFIKKPYVIMNLAGDVHRYRFNEGNYVTIWEFLSQIEKIVKFLLKKNYKVLFALHRMDDLLMKNVADKFPQNVYSWDWRNILGNTNIGLGYYKHAYASIGMRGHSQIIPIGLGVPTISLGQQEKNIGLMRKLGLAEWNIEIGDPDLGLKVCNKFEELEGKRNMLREYYKSKLKVWRKEVKKEFKVISEELSKR